MAMDVNLSPQKNPRCTIFFHLPELPRGLELKICQAMAMVYPCIPPWLETRRKGLHFGGQVSFSLHSQLDGANLRSLEAEDAEVLGWSFLW